MKHIFIIDYGSCNFHNMLSLIESGYKVTMMPSGKPFPSEYHKSLGIEIFMTNRESEIWKFVSENNVDIVINTNPRMTNCYGYVQKLNQEQGKNIEFLGLKQSATVFEMNKLLMTLSAEDLGIKIPHWGDRYDFITSFPVTPYVIKPKICVLDFDFAQIVMDPNMRPSPPKGQYYYENYLPNGIECNISYCIAKGKWAILHTQEVRGEDICKMYSENGLNHWTKHVEFDYLSEEHEKMSIENATKLLDWMAKRDPISSWVGQITGIVSDGHWHYIENNVRPEQLNSLPHFVTGDQYLDALRGNPEILANKEYETLNKVVAIPTEDPDAPYPFHLHEEHGVAIPCGLDVFGDHHILSYQFRGRSPDGIIGIIIADTEIPQAFIEGFEGTGWHIRHEFIEEKGKLISDIA